MSSKIQSIHNLLSYQLTHLCRNRRTYSTAKLTELGMYPGQDQILLRLHEDPGLTQSQLAELLGVQQPTVAKVLQRMEKSGLLYRQLNPEDARTSLLSLTAQGQELIPAILAFWDAYENKTLDGLGADEISTLKHCLEVINQNFLKK